MAFSDDRAAAVEAEVRAAPRPARRLAFAVLVLGFLCALCSPFFVDLIDHGAPRVRAGAVDYASYGPLRSPVELQGEWRVVWRSAPRPGATFPLTAPAAWEGGHAAAPTLPEQGAASYHVKIRGLQPGRYTLFVPSQYAGTEVAINGQVRSKRGAAGAGPADTRYLVRSHQVMFEAEGSDVDLRIDVSAWFHRDNGLLVTPLLGAAEPMADWATLDWIRSLLLITALLLLAIYGTVVFLFRPQDRASLYFGLACVCLLPLEGVFSHDNLVMIALPQLSFAGMMGLQYLTGAMALGLMLAYTHELFPRETPRPVYKLAQAAIGAMAALYALLAVPGDTLALSHVSEACTPIRLGAIIYVVLVVLAASVRRREGAFVFLLGIGMFAGTMIYADMAANAVIPRAVGFDVVPIGMLMLLFSHIVILAERWSLAINAIEHTNSDLRRLLDVNISAASEIRLEALLARIVGVTGKLVQADRTSLFLHDPRSGELCSAVAEGVDEPPLRMACDVGLPGWVFANGSLVNVRDAAKDPRFNDRIDAETGYITRSVLAVPVTARDGRRLGVMQALNRSNSEAFSEPDEKRMSAFAAQAAIAIENATLFSEVAAERNYNESILRSLASGVVTVDADWRVAKLNEAALRIFAAGEELHLTGADARVWLAGLNPTLLAEVEAVRDSGAPKTLLEAELRTAGPQVSANVSIVPLRDDGASGGVLLIVDDITTGRRMQAAMRRFMTQKVVDQVLSREDELLFGVGCEASVLFADIRNFTALAETLQPRETVDMLNEVFTELFEAVAANDGVLDKFLGDAVMAVYGAPISSGRDPQNAVYSAVTMVALVDALNARRRRRGEADLRLGIGIATGEVVAGTIGSPKRMDYTVIGDSVNLAARLQRVTKLYQVGIVVCEATAAALPEEATVRELDRIRVRGRQQPVKVFQVLTGPSNRLTPSLDAYRRGRELMEERRWSEAAKVFRTAVAVDPADHPSCLMLERAEALARQAPDEDWDGIWDQADAA